MATRFLQSAVILIIAAALAACGPSGPIVVIHVDGSDGAAAALKLSVALNDRPASQVETFAASVTELDLQLPEGSIGQLALHLDAVDCHECTTARAMATQFIVNADRHDLNMSLIALPTPACPSGSLLSPRWFYDPVVIDRGPSAGQVYLATGSDLTAPTDPTQRTEIYDPQQLTSRASTPLASVNAHPLRLRDGLVMMAGGYDGNQDRYIGATQIYDPLREELRQGAALHHPRSGHATVALADGRALTLGGKTEPPRMLTATAEIYDPMKDQWTSVDSMAQARLYASAVLLANGKVLVSGGINPLDNYPRELELFDPTAPPGSQWTMVGNLIQGRWSHNSFALPDGKVLIVGGSIGSAQLENAEIFDSNDLGSTSQAVPAAPYTFAYASLVSLSNGAVLAAGGGNGTATTNVQIFDPAIGHFTVGSPLSQARADHTAVRLLDGSVLLLNGVTGAIIRESNAATLLSPERIYLEGCH